MGKTGGDYLKCGRKEVGVLLSKFWLTGGRIVDKLNECGGEGVILG